MIVLQQNRAEWQIVVSESVGRRVSAREQAPAIIPTDTVIDTMHKTVHSCIPPASVQFTW